jgi:hypothetical protein
MKRFASLTFGVCSVVVFAGCAGDLSNPGDFADGGSTPKSAEMVLADSCGVATCHDDITKTAGLDLLSPNVEDRVVNKNSIGLGCESSILVVAGEPDSSYLLDKVLGSVGICESQMPLLDTLPNSDIDILRDWIIDLGGGG